jgi:diaminopimelate epimerase
MRFTKAETNGNDFVIIENLEAEFVDIKKIADRRLGVGADQIIFSNLVSDTSCHVRFFNQNGTEAMMCGNGLCALTKYLGQHCSYVIGDNEAEGSIDDDGFSIVRLPKPTTIESRDQYDIIDVGNKHVVCLKKSDNVLGLLDDYNVHFASVDKSGVIMADTFEKGVGRTMSCGSGAVAIAFACGSMHSENQIVHPGGSLYVLFDDSFAFLRAKSNIVFSGTSQHFFR